MLKRKLYLAVLLLLIAVYSFFGEAGKPGSLPIDRIDGFTLLNSQEHWLMTLDDNPQYADGRIPYEKTFNAIPKNPWQLTIPEAKGHQGNAWFFLQFDISETNKHFALFMPLTYGRMEVYLNGRELLKTHDFESPDLFDNVSKPTMIEIPDGLIKKSGNVLSLRFASFSGWGGLPSFPGFGEYSKVKRYEAFYLLRYTSLGSVSLFLAIFFFLRFLFRRGERYNLWFSLFCFSIGLFLPGYYGIFNIVLEQTWSYYLLTFLGGIFMYLFPLQFLLSFYGYKNNLMMKAVSVFYGLLSSVVLFEFLFTKQIRFFNTYLFIIFNMSYMLIVALVIYIGVKAVKEKKEYSRVMAAGIVFLVICFILSMLVFSNTLKIEPPVGEGFFLMAVVFSIVLAKRFSRTHSDLERAHEGLIVATKEIQELNENLEIKVANRTRELREKNDQITESLNYAARIQESILPTDTDMETLFSDHLTIWKPKGIVGGDFYWSYRTADGFLFAVVDCTGHGVPGALLTMAVSSALDNIVEEMKILEPSEILFQLNKILKSKLNQGNSDPYSDDGLEISLISYTFGQPELVFSSSRLRLLVVENGRITEYQGNRQSLGFKRSKWDQKFESYNIPCSSQSRFFLSTDGFVEQSGGDQGFGFGWDRLKDALLEKKGSLALIREHLISEFDKFRGRREQRDDVLVIGFCLDVK
ncbi:MAG: SpoIIE family protein phosphatase [Spirochaetales bacterium]|nr:SpoIIE family protein phosphatase [Spirochaetales bacterium]